METSAVATPLSSSTVTSPNLVVKALEIGLGILLGIDTQLLELVARSLLQAREEVVATVLDLVKLRRKILGDEFLNRRASATGKHDHTCNQDGHEGRKQQLLFFMLFLPMSGTALPGRGTRCNKVSPYYPLMNTLGNAKARSVRFSVRTVCKHAQRAIKRFPAVQ